MKRTRTPQDGLAPSKTRASAEKAASAAAMRCNNASRNGSKLKNRLVGPQFASPSAVVSRLNRWRDTLNPLRSLIMSHAVSLLEDYDRGIFADLQWTFRAIERSHPTLGALQELRYGALEEMNWCIKVSDDDQAGFDETLADEQRAALMEAYNGCDNLTAAISHLASAKFRGFAHLQKQSTAGASLSHLEIVDQWNIVRDGTVGDWFYNQQAAQVAAASLQQYRLDPAEFVIMEETRPIDRFALPQFLRGNLGEKDWTAFIEIYGIPSGVIIMPNGVPDDETTTWVEMATRVAEGGSGALPNGSSYTPNDAPRGVNPFRAFLDYCEEQLVRVGTGGKLKMLAESGSGTLAGGAHTDTWRTIACAHARKISEAFQRQLDKPLLEAAFPGKPVVAYWQLEYENETDVGQIVEHAAKLSAAGYMMDPGELSERTGYDLTLKPQPTPPTQPGTSNAEPAMSPNETELDTEVAGIVNETDPEMMRNRLEKLMNRKA